MKRGPYDTSGSDDIIRWFVRAIVDTLPGIDTNAVQRIEQRMRIGFGGTRRYLAKSSPGDRVERATAHANRRGRV